MFYRFGDFLIVLTAVGSRECLNTYEQRCRYVSDVYRKFTHVKILREMTKEQT